MTRYAPCVYLTLEQMATRPAHHSLVLVRLQKQPDGIGSWFVAAELQTLPGEDARPLTMALQAAPSEAAAGVQAVDDQLASCPPIQTEEGFFAVLSLLRLRDAYTGATPPALLDAAPDMAARLSQLGYSGFLTARALLGVMRQQENVLDPALLSRPLLLEYAQQRLAELPASITQEDCDELLLLHTIGVRLGVQALPATALKRFHFEPAQQLNLWRVGVGVPLPPQVQLTAELLSSLTVEKLEEYIRQRLPELAPIKSAAAGQELEDLYRISRQEHSEVFTAQLLRELPIAAEHRLTLWLQGAPLPLPHTNFDPAQLTATQLAEYAEQWLKELSAPITEEAVPHLVRLWTLGKQKNQTIFSREQLADLSMEVSCQLALWHAGLPVSLPPTELDPSTLTTAQFEEYAAQRLIALSPVQTETAAQEVLSLYALSQQKRATAFSSTGLAGLEVAASFRLMLWLAGVPHVVPSAPEVVALVQQRLAGQEQEQRQVPELIVRLRSTELATTVLEEVVGAVTSADLPQLLPHVQFKNMPPAYRARLEQLLEQRYPDELLLQWWLDGTLLTMPAHPVARELLKAEEDRKDLLLTFKKQAGSSQVMLLELRQQMLRGQLSTGATRLLDSLAATVRTQGRSNWNVDYWARDVVQGLQNDTMTLAPVEQLAWWLKGIGSEPKTVMLQRLVPTLEDAVLSRLWQSISTPGARALVKAILPWVEREATGHWLQITLSELQGRRAAFYSDACRVLYQKALPRLSSEEQVKLWLLGLSEQPVLAVLQAYWASGADAVQRLLPKLAPQALAQLLPSLVEELTLHSPLVEPILRQLTQQSVYSAACSALRERLLMRLGPMLPADRCLQWWLAGWAPEPTAALLQQAITDLSEEQQKLVIRRCSHSTLLAYGQLLVVEPQPSSRILRDVAIQLHSSQDRDAASEAVVAQLLETVPAEQQVKGWLLGQLPAPSPNVLLTSLPAMEEPQREQAVERCADSLLLASAELLRQWPADALATAKYLVLELVAREQLVTGLELVATLLPQLPEAIQLAWWLEQIKLPVTWNVIQYGLESTAQYLHVASALPEQRLPELREYLPSASPQHLGRLVDIFTQEFTWSWSKNSADRTVLLGSLAEELCVRFQGAPAQRRDFLLRLKQRSRSTQWDWFSRKQETFADEATLSRQIALLAAALFEEPELLECWTGGLLDHFPLTPLSSIACLVAQNHQAAWLTRLSRATGIPNSVVQAWNSLGGLVGAPLDHVRAVAVAHSGALAQTDLLRALTPWLISHLTAEQLEVLWLHGYPVPQPADWERFSFLQRLTTAVHYGQQQRWQELPAGLAPSGEEVEVWLAEQYWEEEDQEQVDHIYPLLLAYHGLAMVPLPSCEELEDELLLHCAGAVRIRLWLKMPAANRERTFNYYTFRRGYSRLLGGEQRTFLRLGEPYLRQGPHAFTAPLHLRRRRLLQQRDGVSIYRVCLAHCFCPAEGHLAVELAESHSTRPAAYPGAKDSWNEQFLNEPWSGCPVIVHVDDQTRELIQIQGLETALAQYPPDQQSVAQLVFHPNRTPDGSRNKSLTYWQDEVFHDELREYLTSVSSGALAPAVLLMAKKQETTSRSARIARTPHVQEQEDEGTEVTPADLDVSSLLRFQQTVLQPVPFDEDVVFVWTPQFAHANQATYLFRAPTAYQEQAWNRLTGMLQGVGNIRSALLAPGQASDRLRRHVGYLGNIKGRRGHREAFERWQQQLDAVLTNRSAHRHAAYDPESSFVAEELVASALTSSSAPSAPAANVPATGSKEAYSDFTDASRNSAYQLLERMREINAVFLLGYPA